MTERLTSLIQDGVARLTEQFNLVQADIRKIESEIADLEARPMDADSAEARLHSLLQSYDTPDEGKSLSHTTVGRFSKFPEVICKRKPLNEWTAGLVLNAFTTLHERPTGSQLRPDSILVDFLPMVLLLFPEKLDLLVGMVRDYAGENEGISDADRHKAMTKLNSKLKALELQEEAIIDEAETNEIWTFTRRPNCDPAIVLGMAEVDSLTSAEVSR